MRDIRQIQKLVGHITQAQLRYVESAASEHVGVFMPMAGQCFYAITPEHTHPAYAFILAFDSRCRTRMGDTVLQSVPSTMTMTPPGVAHQELPSDTVSRYIAVMIEASFFEAQKALYGIGELPAADALYPFSERLVQTCRDFLIDYQEALPGYEQLLQSSELAICHLILRQIRGISQKSHPLAGSITIHRVVEHIYGHLCERLSVDELARLANLSASHFSRLFKKEMNTSPAEYVMQTRLDFAKRMLRANNRSLTEIALDCGFSSSSYFSQCFARAFHLTPSEYRNRYERIE